MRGGRRKKKPKKKAPKKLKLRQTTTSSAATVQLSPSSFNEARIPAYAAAHNVVPLAHPPPSSGGVCCPRPPESVGGAVLKYPGNCNELYGGGGGGGGGKGDEGDEGGEGIGTPAGVCARVDGASDTA